MLTVKRGYQTLSSDFGAHLPNVKQMEHFLSNRKILFEHGHTSLIASCPFCAKDDNEGIEKPKALTLYINKTTGSHFCKNCSASGTWEEFKVTDRCSLSPQASMQGGGGGGIHPGGTHGFGVRE